MVAKTSTAGELPSLYSTTPGTETTNPANVPKSVSRAFSGAYPACSPVSSSGSLRAAISGTRAPFVTR